MLAIQDNSAVIYAWTLSKRIRMSPSNMSTIRQGHWRWRYETWSGVTRISYVFFAHLSSLGYNVYGGDVLDAFTHSPPPAVPTYVSIDNTYANWYFWRTGNWLIKGPPCSPCPSRTPWIRETMGEPTSIWFSFPRNSTLNIRCTTVPFTPLRSAVSRSSSSAKLTILLSPDLTKLLPKLSMGDCHATYPRYPFYPRWTYQSTWLGLTLPPCLTYDGPLPQLSCHGPYFAYLMIMGKFSPACSIPVPVCSTVDNLNSLRPIWILGEGVDQPVHQCLDSLHRHYIWHTDRPYGGKLPKDIDRIRSLFY